MADSRSYELLDERIQRFLWAQGWEELREAQELAIPLILSADRDVIISAATAAGKTEAAFLPALTHLLARETPGLIVYISPLKALINDQFGRLEQLCESLEIPVWPWHGDISSTSKQRFLQHRRGVLLITPESLEALLCNRGSSVAAVFEHTRYFVIDELHAFIGSERGKQLQSLMHRIDRILRRSVVRIGLSATLGDKLLAANFLRPGQGEHVAQVDSKAAAGTLQVLLKGYEEPAVVQTDAPAEGAEDAEPVIPALIATHLFKALRGSNNLVFPNSRREVERYTYLLNNLCTAQSVPNEFWPHHGSLSKEIRAEAEAELKQKERPATAICTNTLELGIDIGAVKSVAQIGPPPSVASLRQRLGRSGRRKGEPAILRGYCVEDAIVSQSSLATRLRLRTTEMIAVVLLMVDKWVEPPVAQGAHYSTLVQQLLSIIAQNGGIMASQAYQLLCGEGGPFGGISKTDFIELLKHLASKELLMQNASGLILHGRIGEKFVNHYSFYAAFASDEEFRIVAGGKTLGSLPVSQMLLVGQRILFGGKTWTVEAIDEEQKTIYVVRARGGSPPLFAGGSGRVHNRVRQKMRELLCGSHLPPFIDATAQRLLAEGQAEFRAMQLDDRILLDQGQQLYVLTWLGDAANEAIACLLLRLGFMATPSGPGIEVIKGRASISEIVDALVDAGADEPPPLDLLLADVKNLQRQKWDWALPDSLLRSTYASLNLDLEEARQWLKIKAPQLLQWTGASRLDPN